MKIHSLWCDVSDDGVLDKSKLSLGRVMLWIAFSFAIHFWFWHPIAEFPPTLSSLMALLLAYNLFSKAPEVVAKFTQGK